MIYLLGFICLGFFYDLSVMIVGIYLLGFLLVPILAPYVIIFGRLDIILKKNSRTSFYLFYSFSFNFIVLRSQATSIWYQSITLI